MMFCCYQTNNCLILERKYSDSCHIVRQSWLKASFFVVLTYELMMDDDFLDMPNNQAQRGLSVAGVA